MTQRMVACIVACFAGVANAGELPRERAAEVDRIATAFAKENGLPSLSVGIVDRDGLAHSFSTGLARIEDGTAATSDTLYRVGSLTKVFTATLLVTMRDGGEVALDDALSKYLPPGTSVPSNPRGAPAISLRHLAQHTSGLPRLPPTVFGADQRDPYAGITPEVLLADLSRSRLESPTGERFQYSNFGTALLGLALENAASKPYPELLTERVLAPLGMQSSTFVPTESTSARWTSGYGAGTAREAAPDWNMAAIAPAGGLCSSVNDLARFVSMNLRAGEADAPLVAAGSLFEMQAPSRMIDASWEEAVGLGWIVRKRPGGDVVWHNGMTGNHASAVFMVPSRDVGVVCLTNTAKDLDGLAWKLLGALAREEKPASQAVAVPPEVEKAGAEVVAAFADPSKADLKALFSPAFLAEVPEMRVRAILVMLNSAKGAPKSHAITPAEAPPGAWTVVMTTERDGRIAASFMLEPVDGGRIVYFVAKPL